MYRFYATLAGAVIVPVTVEEDLGFPVDGLHAALASECQAGRPRRSAQSDGNGRA